MIQAVIFDHDGTIVNSEVGHYQVWHTLLKEYDVDLPEQEFIRYYAGLPTLATAECIIEKYQLKMDKTALFNEKLGRANAFFETNLPPLMPHVMECIKFCHEHFKLAVATGTSQNDLRRSLTHHALSDFFMATACGNEVTQNKPAPDVYQLAAQRLAIEPKNCVALEDSYNGLQSAKAAGLCCIAIPNDFTQHQDFSDADYIAKDLVEAKAIINEHFI